MTTARRRWRWLSIVAVANLAAVGLAAGPSQAHHRVATCDGVAEGVTVFGDLVVPEEASCLLIDSRVTDDVEVRADANLELEGSRVGDDVTVRQNGFVSAIDSSVRGTTQLRRAFGAVVVDSRVGRVTVRDSGFFVSDATTHRRGVSSRNGQTVLASSQLSGSLDTDGDLLTDVIDSVVTGRVTINETEIGSVFCRSEIDRQAEIRDSGDVVQIGAGALVPDCAFNVFGDDLELRGNQAGVQVAGNVIRDDLECAGNDQAPVGEANRVRGEAEGQCADLAPAAAAAPQEAGTAGTPEARTAELRNRIADRSAAAEAAAAAAGPAGL